MNQTNSYPCKMGVSEPPHPEVSKRGPQSPQQRAAADQPHSHTRVVTCSHTHTRPHSTHSCTHARTPSPTLHTHCYVFTCSHAHSQPQRSYTRVHTHPGQLSPPLRYIHTYIHTASHRILLKQKVSLFETPVAGASAQLPLSADQKTDAAADIPPGPAHTAGFPLNLGPTGRCPRSGLSAPKGRSVLTEE